MALLEAMRCEGFLQVIKEKERILNRYFKTPKTEHQVDRLLKYYFRKSRKYNFYALNQKWNRSGHQLRSDRLFKWHKVLPEGYEPVETAIGAAVRRSTRCFDTYPYPSVIKALSTMLTGENNNLAHLDALPSLILVKLLKNLETEAVASSHDAELVAQFKHVSDSFWRWLRNKETGHGVTQVMVTGPEAMKETIDPFNLSKRLELQELVARILEMCGSQ